MARKKVLEDYKKNKKKYLAPMNHLLQDRGWTVNAVEISHRYEIIPEIIWIAILHEKIGIELASEILPELLKIGISHKQTEKSRLSCFASSWKFIDLSGSFVQELEEAGFVEIFSTALSGFIHLFPESAISCLVHKKQTYEIGELQLIKELVNKLSDSSSEETIFAMASVVYPAVINGLHQVDKSIDISPKKLLDYPDTFDSQRIASFLRNSIRMLYGNSLKGNDNLENRYFWKRCLELEPCKLKSLDDE